MRLLSPIWLTRLQHYDLKEKGQFVMVGGANSIYRWGAIITRFFFLTIWGVSIQAINYSRAGLWLTQPWIPSPENRQCGEISLVIIYIVIITIQWIVNAYSISGILNMCSFKIKSSQATLWGKHYCYAHFMNEKAEYQRDCMAYSGLYR